MSEGFSCTNVYLYPNGLMSVSITQLSGFPINVTAIGCTTNSSLNSVAMFATNSIYMPVGSNHTFYVTCYTASGLPLSGKIGQSIIGSIIINYTDDSTGFHHDVYGKFSESIT